MAEKKGLPWYAWVGIGCGVLVVLAVIAVGGLGIFVTSKVKDVAQDFEERPVYTTASAVARFNPDIELVSADEEARTVVLRSVETGEEMTFDLKDIQSGNFSFEKDGERVEVRSGSEGITVDSGEGTTRIGGGSAEDLPDWVPLPPGVDLQVSFSSSSDGEASGITQLVGFDSADEVLEFYRRELSAQGFEISDQNYSGGGSTLASMTAQKDEPRRTVVVAKVEENGETKVTMNFNGAN